MYKSDLKKKMSYQLLLDLLRCQIVYVLKVESSSGLRLSYNVINYLNKNIKSITFALKKKIRLNICLDNIQPTT